MMDPEREIERLRTIGTDIAAERDRLEQQPKVWIVLEPGDYDEAWTVRSVHTHKDTALREAMTLGLDADDLVELPLKM